MISTLSEDDIQAILESFMEAYHTVGLSVNVKKTQVLYQVAPG